MTEQKLQLNDNAAASAVFGYQDKNLRQIGEALQVEIIARGTDVTVRGEEAAAAEAVRVLQHLQTLAAAGVEVGKLAVGHALATKDSADPDKAALLTRTVFTTPRGRAIKPKTFAQYQFLHAMDTHDITFAIGPAGTGKTFLAVMKAAAALRSRQVSRLVLVRPAVEAGEKLGFLPGDMQEKVNPYLRPVYDALDEALGVEAAAKAIERGTIEVVPLAYMRGRTLNDAFIILDEAQNTTPQQMKMFLTRIGERSRAVITGDVTQIDLPPGTTSGLVQAEAILSHIRELAFCYLTKVDVVRHPLVQKIIEAYEGN